MKILLAGVAACALLSGAEWPTDGGNSQRTNFQPDEKILTKDNVKNLKILWKLKLDNVPHEMHALFPPLIVENVKTANGLKQVAVEAGIDDRLYAIDVENGQILWSKHFQYPTPERAGQPGDPLCPTGQTATPVVSPMNGADARTVYALAGDGKIHSLNVADGEDVGAGLVVRHYEQQRLTHDVLMSLGMSAFNELFARGGAAGWLAARALGLAGASPMIRRAFASRALGLAGELPRIARRTAA